MGGGGGGVGVGGGVVQKKESPDFRSLEVGISALVTAQISVSCTQVMTI